VRWVDLVHTEPKSKLFHLGHRSASRQYCSPSFDLDYPLEVDDEFWLEEDPKQSPKQPLGKPSLVTAFNLLLKLYQIQALTLRTIVCLPRIIETTNLLIRLQYTRIGYVIAEFDSALNKWVDFVPDYCESIHG